MGEEISEPSDSAEEQAVDVKAKLAKMSGTKLREQKAKQAAAARKSATESGRITTSERDAVAVATEYQPEFEPQPEGEEPPRAAQQTEKPTPQPKSKGLAKPKSGSQKAPALRATSTKPSATRSLPAPAAFVAGLVGGLLPLVVFLVSNALSTEGVTNLPANAVERADDWIHCPKSVSADRWSCDVHDFRGEVIGKGEFVPQTASAIKDWKVLAEENLLVPDGEYDALAAKSTILYVRGVAVASTRVSRSK